MYTQLVSIFSILYTPFFTRALQLLNVSLVRRQSEKLARSSYILRHSFSFVWCTSLLEISRTFIQVFKLCSGLMPFFTIIGMTEVTSNFILKNSPTPKPTLCSSFFADFVNVYQYIIWDTSQINFYVLAEKPSSNQYDSPEGT